MRIGFIGAGNMGGALAQAINNVSGASVVISSYNQQKATALQNKIGCEVDSTSQIVKTSKFLFIGVKPNAITSLYEEIKLDLALNENAIIVSMLAGVTLEKLESLFKGRAIIRIMPNTPVAVGKGATVWCANSLVLESDKSLFKNLMAYTGLVEEIEEDILNACCAVSGCGPAFVYKFIGAMITAGEELGLTPEQAKRLACQTVLGSAEMVVNSIKTTNELCNNVCSPGGATIEGVKVLNDAEFEGVVSGAVKASHAKTELMQKK